MMLSPPCVGLFEDEVVECAGETRMCFLEVDVGSCLEGVGRVWQMLRGAVGLGGASVGGAVGGPRSGKGRSLSGVKVVVGGRGLGVWNRMEGRWRLVILALSLAQS